MCYGLKYVKAEEFRGTLYFRSMPLIKGSAFWLYKVALRMANTKRRIANEDGTFAKGGRI